MTLIPYSQVSVVDRSIPKRARIAHHNGLDRILEDIELACIPDRTPETISLQRLAEGMGVTLKRHGADLIGLCPFHDDHDPQPGDQSEEQSLKKGVRGWVRGCLLPGARLDIVHPQRPHFVAR